ncbi:MAG: outer membrane beta-barrel protein [Geminicoccaceae bacterium]
MTPDPLASEFFPSSSGSIWISGAGFCALPLLLGLLAATPSSGAEDAQEPPPDPLAPATESDVNQRGYFGGGSVPSSLLTPSRLRLGDFALSGQASLGMLYDDNVEADDDARDEDVFLTFAPSVRAQSTYARHSIGFGAGASAGTALKDSTDDFFDWQIGADGRLDLSRTSKVNASLSYSRDVEDDENVDAEDDEGDTPIHNFGAGLGYSAGGDRLGFSVDSTVSRLDVEGDDFEDRDSTTLGLSGKLKFGWSDKLSFSMGPSYRHATFDEDEADDGDGRDADRYAFQFGAGYRASRTISTRASLGYAILTFDDPDREDENTATGSAGLTWSPGNGTTLDLNASRSLELSIEDGEDSRTSTSASATLAHRLRLGSRSVLSSTLGLSVTRLSDLDRTDKNLTTGLTFGYRLAERAVLTSSYRFSRRFSDEEDAEFYRNLVSIGVTLSY